MIYNSSSGEKMAEDEKEYGFMGMIKDGLGYITQIISASIFPQLAQGAELVMKTIDERILLMEKRIIRKICSMFVIGFGVVFLVFALFFFLIEFFHWSNAAAFFSIGITVLVIGLLLKIREFDK